jgi:UDP-glucose 4-epimerase
MDTLVTGGAGFIGSTLTDRLLADGHRVTVLDDFSAGSRDNLAASEAAYGERLAVIEADVRDASVTEQVRDVAPEVLFHLAAQADVRVSVADPAFDAAVNVVGSLNVIEGARLGGARKVVFASSGGTIYGDPEPSALPVDETHPRRPVSPYGVAKMAVGDYLEAFRVLHGLDYTALALANVYGPRQDPHGEAGVVAIFAGRLLAGETCTVFGTGEQTRDFVYVDDVVDAFARAADAAPGQLLNIGTGEETSVNRLYSAMAGAAGADVEAERAEARPGELDRSALDGSRATEYLGWEPQVSLDEGVSRVLDWFRAR